MVRVTKCVNSAVNSKSMAITKNAEVLAQSSCIIKRSLRSYKMLFRRRMSKLFTHSSPQGRPSRT